MTSPDRTAAAPGAASDPLERLRIDRSPAATTRRRRGRGWIVVALLLLVGAGSAVFAMREQLTAPTVRTAKVRRITATEGAVRTTASGYVVARTRAAISSKLSGRLEKLNVDVGDRVTAGQVLGELGHADLDAAVAQAEADVEVRRRDIATAEAQRTAAEAASAAQRVRVVETEAAVREMQTRLADADRIVAMQERIFAGGAGTRDAVDAARSARSVLAEQVARMRANVESARSDVARAEADAAAAAAAAQAAQAALQVAEAGLAHARAVRQDAFIVAPFAGVVVRKEAEVGEMVSPVSAVGTTTRGAVVTLVDFATLEMEVDVIERDIGKVQDGAPCRIVLDARRDHPYAGVVRQMVPTAERATSTVQVKVAFRALDAFVLPDMGGRVEFLAPEKADVALAKDRVLAAADAFTSRDGASGVWTVRDGRVAWQPAAQSPGQPSSGDVEVAEGLAGGEEVVVSPPAGLAPGSLVKSATPE